MIIVSNDSSSSSGADTDKQVVNVDSSKSLLLVSSNVQHDPPPSYHVTGTPTTISSESAPNNRGSTFPNIKPSNFVSLSRMNGSIKGSWLIDPSLHIPSSFLPPLPPTAGARRNLFLESKNGTIDADIFMASTSLSKENTTKYILIHTDSLNGSIKARLHDTRSSNGEVRLPVRLSACCANGAILVHLPRSFRGPIRIKAMNGNTHFSAAVREHLTPFSEMNHVQRSFLGHFNPSQWDMGTPWEGDELSVEAKNGSVKIFFDDEPEVPRASMGQSFFSRIFSL
ncbi:hypothetical protein BYT27DRAFT_6859314 [Phlegmacium glaucopus]|nr:hypothetical protein BYT27DRAFT_6859314 [Phlegmacium glaucopus]